MKRELSDVLANWGLSEGDLLARFRELEQAVPKARTALEASRQDLDAAKRDRDQGSSRVRFALRQIQSDPDLRGVHKVMGDLASEGDGAAAALQSLAVRARSMTDALDAGVTDLESIRDLLDQASGQPSLSSGDPPSLETLKGAIFGTLDAGSGSDCPPSRFGMPFLMVKTEISKPPRAHCDVGSQRFKDHPPHRVILHWRASIRLHASSCPCP